MDVRDGWATEYARKAFSVTVDEGDFRQWLAEKVGDAAGTVTVKWLVKARIMRLLAYCQSAVALAEWGDHEGDSQLTERARRDLAEYEGELANWAEALVVKFGGAAPAAG